MYAYTREIPSIDWRCAPIGIANAVCSNWNRYASILYLQSRSVRSLRRSPGVSSSPQANRWAINLYWQHSVIAVNSHDRVGAYALVCYKQAQKKKNCRHYNILAYESSYSAKLNALHLILTAKEDGHSQVHDLKFVIPKRQAITLIRLPSSEDPVYFYHMKWRLCCIQYTLKINTQTLVSLILKCNTLLQVIHRIS